MQQWLQIMSIKHLPIHIVIYALEKNICRCRLFIVFIQINLIYCNTALFTIANTKYGRFIYKLFDFDFDIN